MNRKIWPALAALVLAAGSAHADQVIADDLIVQGSVCVGIPCVNAYSFGFDTLVIQADLPGILFEDTSSTGSFPSNDWFVGLVAGAAEGSSDFVVRDYNADAIVLRLAGDGTVALGSGAALVANAISFGATGTERRIANVAAAVDDTDAVTLAQFEAFQDELLASVGLDDAATLDADIADLGDRLTDLLERIAALEARLGMDE